MQIIPSEYVASTTLRISTSRDEQVSYEEILYADRILKTYAEIAAGSQVEAELGQELGLDERPKIEAQVIPNSELIRISSNFSDPKLAQEAIIILSDIILEQDQKLGSRPNLISVVDMDISPSLSPLYRTLIPIMAAVLGFIAGLGLAFLFENLEPAIDGDKQISSALDLPILGLIPKTRKDQTILANNSSPKHFSQAYQTLRTNILMKNQKKPLKTLLVSSINQGDGKSTVVANLAYMLKQMDKKVVVIDGDMRRPKIHKLFGLPNALGLSDILGKGMTLSEVSQDAVNGITVITCGSIPDDPPFLLMVQRLESLMEELSERFDYILIDTPTILSVPDVKLLAKYSDSMVLITTSTNISQAAVEKVIEGLSETQVETPGIVINRASRNPPYYY
jgi:capsular exopolysaccharide synthesis family protein